MPRKMHCKYETLFLPNFHNIFSIVNRDFSCLVLLGTERVILTLLIFLPITLICLTVRTKLMRDLPLLLKDCTLNTKELRMVLYIKTKMQHKLNKLLSRMQYDEEFTNATSSPLINSRTLEDRIASSPLNTIIGIQVSNILQKTRSYIQLYTNLIVLNNTYYKIINNII